MAGPSLESIVLRPRLRPLSLLEQLRAILKPVGWACEPSDRGIYVIESLALFGNSESQFAQILRDAAVRPVLNAYLKNNRTAPDSRRCLSLEDMKATLGGDAATARDALHRLLTAGALRQGIRLKCVACRQSAWYETADLGETFNCVRCQREQPQIPASWMQADEPVWRYSLAEVLYQFLLGNGDVPFLTCQDILISPRGPVSKTFELSVSHPGTGPDFEIDVVASEGHRLIVGESSKDPTFQSKRSSSKPGSRKRKFERLRRFADRVDARTILLSTSEPQFPPETEQDARRQLASDWIALELHADVKLGP